MLLMCFNMAFLLPLVLAAQEFCVKWPLQFTSTGLQSSSFREDTWAPFLPYTNKRVYGYDAIQRRTVEAKTFFGPAEHSERLLLINTTAYDILATNGSCVGVDLGVAPLKPDFTCYWHYEGLDYVLREQTYYLAHRWYQSLPGTAQPFIYFHRVDYNVPIFLIGIDSSPKGGVMCTTYDDVQVGLDAAPNGVFDIPSGCQHAHQPQDSRPVPPPPVQASAPEPSKVANIYPPAPNKQAWPDTFHTPFMITGTNETSEEAVHVVDTGHFYYDFPNKRTVSLLKSTSSGREAWDVVMNGTFYSLDRHSGECYSYKVPGVGGPVSPDFVTKFDYNRTQYIQRPQGFALTYHWSYDAFNFTMANAFNYLDDAEARLPTRIWGPSWLTPPYGHSFIEFLDVQVGLAETNKMVEVVVQEVQDACGKAGTHSVLQQHPKQASAIARLLHL